MVPHEETLKNLLVNTVVFHPFFYFNTGVFFFILFFRLPTRIVHSAFHGTVFVYDVHDV